MAILLLVFSTIGQIVKYGFGHDRVFGLVNFVFVDKEFNLPTFFAVLIILFSAMLLAIIAAIDITRQGPYRLQWTVLSLGFLYLAFDEAFSMHERLISPIQSLFGDAELGFFYFAWVIPGIIIVIGLALYFRKFLLGLPGDTRRRFIIAAGLYLGGAIGIELIGGRYAELNPARDFTYSMIVTLEEGLEMSGIILFIWSLLKHCSDHYSEVSFTFKDQQSRKHPD
jgi:hypothetical protein